MNPSITAQASQAAQQGQDLLKQFQGQSATAGGQYTDFTNKATDANKNLETQAAYMRGEGSGTNLYEGERTRLQNEGGYNPAQLADANKTLFSLTGALNGANTAFNTPGGVGAYGMSAPALAGYEGSIMQPLQTGVANANTQVGALNSQLQTFETGASQYATAGVQGEQATADALTKAVVNYQTQAAGALQNMQFYSQLAQQQGGLNAQQAQSYATAQQAYASAQQAIAQAGLILSQTRGQNISNTAAQNQLNIPKPAPPKPNNSSIKIAGSGVQGSSIPIQVGSGGIQGSGMRIQ